MPITTSSHWTIKAKGTFLAALAGGDTVSAAATAAGLSRETAYRLRARNARFARAWATALAVAQDRRDEAWRAAHAVRTPVEPFMRRRAVVYQGKVVGYRDTLDATALLRTMARLYKWAASGQPSANRISDTSARKPAETGKLPHPRRANRCDPASPLHTRRHGLDPGQPSNGRDAASGPGSSPGRQRSDEHQPPLHPTTPRHRCMPQFTAQHRTPGGDQR